MIDTEGGRRADVALRPPARLTARAVPLGGGPAKTGPMTATEPTHRGRARIAEPGEGIGLDELALATRNHGMPLEALRYDVTPPGLHYVLTHYDIPAVDPATWSLEVEIGRAHV